MNPDGSMVVHTPPGASATFDHKNLSLGFTRHAGSAFFALAGLGWACVRYKLNAGYMLLFFLGFVIVVTAWIGFFIVRKLTLSLLHTENVFSGSPAVYSVQIKAPARGGVRRNLDIYLGKSHQRVTLEPGQSVTVPLNCMAAGRGRGHVPVILLQTVQSFGFWRMSALWQPTATHWVYPRAEANAPSAADFSVSGLQGQRPCRGNDTVSGLIPYARGDSMRRIAWRAMARTNGQVIASKQLESHESELFWLSDIQASAGTANTEAMLERLTAWVLEAHAKGWLFGLQLGAKRIAPSHSAAHLDECLQALASHEQEGFACSQ